MIAVVAQAPALWVDSLSTPAYFVGVSGSSADLVRVTIRLGSRIVAVSARGEDVKQFGDSAVFLLTKAPQDAAPVSYSVAGPKLRMTYVRAGDQSTVHFNVDGDRGVDVQPTVADAMRIVGILRGAAFWAVEQHRIASNQGARGAYPSKPGVGYDTYYEFQVERPAVPLAGNPPPTFPPTLRSAKVEGRVLAQFVVDTLGRADTSTFHILRSTHELFTAAVIDVLPKYRFRPAELGGHKVKQLVQMPFDFSIDP